MKFTSAVISADGKYRYSLMRIWGDEPRATFVMLNPSIADAEVDDPTIRRCVGFAKSWKCGGIEVVNLFAYRATNPVELYPPPVGRTQDPVGPENNRHIMDACTPHRRISVVICAWGAAGSYADDRIATVKGLLKGVGAEPNCLALTMRGEPRHPLYLRKELSPQRWAL